MAVSDTAFLVRHLTVAIATAQKHRPYQDLYRPKNHSTHFFIHVLQRKPPRHLV